MVITFYSYKGGVGRTQLLANTAVGLVNRGLKVAMVDMDLESPGLHNFFYDGDRPLCSDDYSAHPGLIDALVAHLQAGDNPPDITSFLRSVKHPNQHDGELWLLHAGRMDTNYARLVASFPWEHFYSEARGYAYMEYLRRALLEGDGKWRGADAVLIDSRTGLTDVSSICTGQLPDVLVILFALHVQGIEGARHIAQTVSHFGKTQEASHRVKKIFLLPSRVEENGSLEQRDKMLSHAATSLFGLGELLDGLQDRLPYDPRIAYGEQVIVGSKTQPTILSQAYERFVDLIVEFGALEDGMARGRFTAPDDANIVPAQLLSTFEVLKTTAERVADLWLRVQTSGLDKLANNAHLLIDAYRVVQGHYNRFRAEAAKLASSTGVALHQIPEGLPQRWEEWDPAISELKETCERFVNAWIDNWESSTRQRLTRAADNPLPEIEQLLGKWRGRARQESAETLETLVYEGEQYLRRDSLNQLLKDRKLSSAELSRIIPEDETRKRWLEHRLTRLQEEGDLANPQVVNELWNSLQLLVALPQDTVARPAPSHWSAYDILCMAVSSQNSGEAAAAIEMKCFEEVGEFLWRAEWLGFLAQERLGDPDWPCGLEARKQLDRVSRVPRRLDSVAELVAKAFAPEARTHSDLRRLLEYRADDPILELSILKIGMDASIARSREILAVWLTVRQQQVSVRALSTFLHALADDGFEAEAFYGGCAALARNPQFFQQDSSMWVDIVARFIVLLWEKQQYAIMSELILESDVVELLANNSAGEGLLAALAISPPPSPLFDHNSLPLVRIMVLHKLSTILPQPFLVWLENLGQRELSDEKVSADIHRLNEDAKDKTVVTIYKSWEAAVYFENSFHEYWMAVYEAIVDETRPLDALKTEHFRESAIDWIDQIHKQLRSQGKRATRPEGRARQHLLDAHRSVVESFVALLEARPRGMSVHQALRYSDERGRAFDSLKTWMNNLASGSANAAVKRVSEHLERLSDDR